RGDSRPRRPFAQTRRHRRADLRDRRPACPLGGAAARTLVAGDRGHPDPVEGRAMSALPPPRRLSETEFVALMALIFALLAVTIDSMLPAFPDIAAELTPDAPNRA